MTFGTVGAIAAGIIGMLLWFFIIKLTNTEYGIIAWGVGGLVGFGCRILGAGYSQKLGIIAGACALVAIIGGEFLATKTAFNAYMSEMMEDAYAERLAFARDATQASSDEDIRKLVAQDASTEEETVLPENVSAEAIDQFRADELPKLKEFAEGKPSKAEFMRQIQQQLNRASVQAMILKESLSFWTLLWLFLGIGTAYRLGTGQTE